MKHASRRMAVCGLSAALCVALMAVGSAFGVLTYVCPLLAGLVVGAVREEQGIRDALTLWAAAGLLALLLVSDLEMSVLFAGLFGWYPALRPALDRLYPWLGRLCKAALYLGAALLCYGGLILLLGLDGLELGGWAENCLLLVLGGVIFFAYDRVLDRMAPRLIPWLRRRL